MRLLSFLLLAILLPAGAWGQATQPSIAAQLAPVAAAADAQIIAANQSAALAQAARDALSQKLQAAVDAEAALQKLLDAANAALTLRPALPPGLGTIPAGSDLAKLRLLPNTAYFAAGPVSVTGAWQPPANISIYGSKSGAGTPLTIILPAVGGTGIDCRWGSPNFELAGFAISCPPKCTILEGGAFTHWHRCSIETTYEEGMVQRSPQATGCLVESIVAKKAGGARLVLIDGADLSITRNNTAGSLGEAVLRVIQGDDGHVAQATVITGNSFSFSNVPASLQKPPLDLRWGNGMLVAINPMLGDWTRMGESQGLTATNILYLGNTHPLGPTGIPPVQLMGASAIVDGNIASLTASMPMIALGGASQLLSANGNTKISTDHKPLKPLGPGQSDGTNTKTRP